MTKAAIDYLKASGATAISVVAIDGVCTFHVGHKIDPHAVLIQWLPETVAASIVKQDPERTLHPFDATIRESGEARRFAFAPANFPIRTGAFRHFVWPKPERL